MAARSFDSNPWPAQTPASIASSSSSSSLEQRSPKRRRRVYDATPEARDEHLLDARQVVAGQSLVQKALTDCQFNSGNDVISCFPTAGTTIPQHQWASFVWNSRRPELTQINLVDIFLFRGDSRQEILRFTRVQNPTDQAGVVTAQVDDRWFGGDGLNFHNQNVSFPFYWVIIRSDKTLDGNQIAQPTFTAVQTTVADSVAASQSSASVSSASAASASAALASLSSLSALSRLSTRVTTISGTPTTLVGTLSPSSIQNASSSDNFPRWAIAVIVVLGFLAIAATCILAFLIIRRIRRRNREEIESNRNSMGSASPMMANAQQGSPLLSPTVLAATNTRRPDSLRKTDSQQNAPSVVLHDGESGVSGEGGPFSGADAAIMADAFRKMLRKPDFASRPVEEGGESPESTSPMEGEEAGVVGGHMISRELAEEGRDIRSVSSSRGVKVESQSDQDHGDR